MSFPFPERKAKASLPGSEGTRTAITEASSQTTVSLKAAGGVGGGGARGPAGGRRWRGRSRWRTRNGSRLTALLTSRWWKTTGGVGERGVGVGGGGSFSLEIVRSTMEDETLLSSSQLKIANAATFFFFLSQC